MTRTLRTTVASFAQERLAPLAADSIRDNRFPLSSAINGQLACSITVETARRAGLGYLAHFVAMEEISPASAAVGLSYFAHSNLCVNNCAVGHTLTRSDIAEAAFWRTVVASQ